jgi:hypothetical protein
LVVTLEEMLALLPDNDIGAIDASDLRQIVAGLWDLNAQLEARLALLATGTGGASHPSVTGTWQVNPSAGAVPGGKQFTTNTGLVSTAAWIRFDQFDLSDTDMGQSLLTADSIFMQQKSNSANWARLTVSGAAVDAGSYIQVPVSGFEGAGSIIPAAWQTATVALGFSA